MLIIDELSVRVAGRLLIDQASVRIPEGSRIGLVGRNGTGKSTLFNVMMGEIAVERGDVEIPPRWRIRRLAQEAPSGSESLLNVVLAADTERAKRLPTFKHGSPTWGPMRRRPAPHLSSLG
jgi:ATP-binding cassette subfamily F protein 3